MSKSMEELNSLAAHCGLEESSQAELAVGGFIRVLKKSENFDDADVDKIVAFLEAEEFVQEYEKIEFRKGIPKPNPIIIMLPKPKPGPPPIMIASAVAKGLKRKSRKDKDAMHTEDCVKILKSKKMKEEDIGKFMSSFIVFVESTVGLDTSEVLCLPQKD
ncbi:expressed unknown protein [Seminavis robusta]|uniref:Uncharacterized protein n=1 Tax=Seminavis robusta TaxID=568900 RepID=A0A9N8E9P5_9STRA|nr:expressed unknown protein [Seminavis robusta]|eukprot:Sro779_g201290.1 n/a (160) ;mRNA; r:24629-25108